ncbi:MAG: NFACT RNA binding domain-containing protein [Spirochaetaceae bacterium]|nr:NFACT RNA binding domain-containing protein [Spirochaetaceae bacterium]
MSLNTKEIDLILSELDIEGFQIQKIIQPDFSSLVMTIYKAGIMYNLLISLKQGKTRLNITSKLYGKHKKQQRFEQFLKARIIGSYITEISQPGKDRIIKITVDHNNVLSFLWIRLWGGNANIIVTDNDMVILESFYRKPGKNEISGEKFIIQDITSGITDDNKYQIRTFSKNSNDEKPFNTFIDNLYQHQEEDEERINLKEKIDAKIIKKLSLLKSSRNRVLDEIKESGNYESFKQYGQLILGSVYLIKQGDKWFETENYFENNNIVSIELDTNLSPEQNAENYFKKYKKKKGTESNLLEEKENILTRINYLENLLESVSTIEDISELIKFLDENELKKDSKEKESAPGLLFFSGKFKIMVGRTASENDELLRKHTNGNDYWLHARDYPGGYVFIKAFRGKSIPLETLIDAGNLAVFFSKGKNSGKGEVYYTQVKYLRRAKDSKKGTVLPTQEKNLSISLDDKILKKFLGK